MATYRRLYHHGGCYVFTVNLANRNSKSLTEHIDLRKASIRHVKQKYPFHIEAIVVLPEHVHCVWTLPTDDMDYSTHTSWAFCLA